MKRLLVPFDFETKKIEQRPVYPPEPVGVAIKFRGRSRYLAWGHPTENNCSRDEAKKIIVDIFRNHTPLMHHSEFDIDVAMEYFGAPFPETFEDTLFLSYLHDPRELDLGLKPLSDKYLDMPPEEQEALHNWIYEHIFVPNKWKVTKKNPLGAYISEAPGKLVGRYAVGDIVRTEKLFNFMMPYVKERGMMEAYMREKKVMPTFMQMSNTGICVHTSRLRKDLKQMEKQQDEWAGWIRKRLKSRELDIASNIQLADALESAGKVDHWIKTEKGNRSTARDNLVKVCNDAKLVEILGLHSQISTYISTFARPWLESAEQFDGRVYPSFNQVRSTDDQGKGRGTRTGRPSSNNPNFLNVPRNQEHVLLPNMRDYLIPDPGCVFLIRDYSQQELRILAYYEEGVLYVAYMNDPTTDAHELVGELIKQAVHHAYPRKHVKIVNFGMVYGMGREATANKIEGSIQEATQLIAAHRKALPGVPVLNKAIQKHARKGNPIYTWGGREYYAEEPRMIRGRMRDFYYKLLNYLIQGSAADCTKEAMIRADERMSGESRLALQVYDELVACAPKDDYVRQMRILKDSMELEGFDIPMLTDGKLGKKSWGGATEYKDPK